MDLTDRFPKYRAYPPVPNWYSSNVTAIVDPHLFLYATRNLIVALSLDDFRYFNSFAVSNDKVQAIAAHDTFCYTAGVDKSVRGWNIILGTLFTSHEEHKAEVTAMKLIREGTVLITGDKSGKIVATEPFGNRKASDAKVKSEITSFSVTTHDGEDYLAVGYANGMIFVEHIGPDLAMTTAYQIASDNDTIQSLDWQKSRAEVWPMLASSTKRKKNISIWAFPSQSLIATIRLPNAPTQATEQQKSSVYIELAWSPLIENRLYLSTYIGAIVCFDIGKKFAKMCSNERLEKHSRNVFTINWCYGGRHCITTSLDKQVIKWDVVKKSCLQTLKTQTAFPYSLDTSHLNSCQLAVGLGDNSIKLWNFSDAASVMKGKKRHNYFDAHVLWKGLQGKIKQIKWHTQMEGTLAYSNEYGHVGIYDTINLRHIPFKHYHKVQGVPSIDWTLDMSDALNNDTMKDTLVSCGNNGMIHVYNAQRPQAAPIILNKVLKEKNSAWFASMESKASHQVVLKVDQASRLIAFGHTDGIVEVYNLDTLKLLFVSNCQRKLIRSLDWKHLDGELYLASGCDKGDIAIHRIDNSNIGEISEIPVPQAKPLVLLQGHKKGITDMKWCPEQNSPYIASASEDNFVVVWNAIEGKGRSLFRRHRSRVLSVAWNLSEPGVVFSGSEDRFLYEWNMNDFMYEGSLDFQPSLYETEKSVWNKRKAEGATTQVLELTENNCSFKLKKKVKQLTPLEEIDIYDPPSSMAAAQGSERSTSRIKREQYCLMLADKMLDGQVKQAFERIKAGQFITDQNQDPKIVRYINLWGGDDEQKEPQRENIHELFYGDKNNIHRLIEIESNALDSKETSTTSTSNYNAHNDMKTEMNIRLAMDVMQCQYSKFNQEHFDANTNNSCMSEWIMLALSPMVGKQTWMDLMLKQAKKLESIRQLHLSASCYIACSHIYEAVEVYRKHSMFREAIALAKLRLPPKDPIVDKLFADWANELQKSELDTLTATCYLMSNTEGSIINATNVLARSGKESSLFYAACLSSALNDGSQADRIEQWVAKVRERRNKKAVL